MWTFSEARRAIRAASRGESFPISQELDDVLTCESWGISQDLLDKMPEEDVMYRKFVAYARYIEGKT
ncbi:hypothetical protein MSHOH_1450 [Methanosarcina horonobensis HB-1 = JCM 15518]|uniref:Uncharacterized protein n=1 Tax=Methanosarcina horonobensis HB-1 = JCM 15518 TaxID=1434110 RepID=A0A0E3SEJ8_9EURY|nr:hypothetical protein [Methanosarcina horonobensis]AKB77933.1 hypothetical protein MSHOH_1450 [Methanosarcina horonobensis HB-1 = JCM 15518]